MVSTAFQKASALHVFDRSNHTNCTSEIIAQLNTRFSPLGLKHNLPAYAMRNFLKLAARVNSIHSTRTRASENQWS
jgi:hypothetical protein